MNFAEFSTLTLQQLQSDIDGFISACDLTSPLGNAALYAMTNGGKRVRPLLIAATYLTLHQPAVLPENSFELPVSVRRAMMAVECLHGYSLVHDDLPCMDDDALRRGRPTTHIAYGEAAAMLAGDVLQTLAFEAFIHEYFEKDECVAPSVLTTNTPKTNPLKNNTEKTASNPQPTLLSIFAPRARRMVIGQMLDLNGESQQLNQAELEAIHRDKTGALIEAAVLMGAVCGTASDSQRAALQVFAQNIGLAFQVQDDILDVTASTETLGKPSGSDEKLDKSTYVKLLGVTPASRYAEQLFNTAKTAVSDNFGEHNLLMDLANWLWARQK